MASGALVGVELLIPPKLPAGSSCDAGELLHACTQPVGVVQQVEWHQRLVARCMHTGRQPVGERLQHRGGTDRRGKVGGMDQRGNAQVVRAEVPLSEMFGYATDLRSRTQGRASYTMQFDSYQQMPGNLQEEIVARVRGE